MKKILIANRGEIAVRVIRACRDMGHRDASRSIPNATAPPSTCGWRTRRGPIGPNPPRESYLRIDRIIDAARRAGADAVHPGYGFLAENEDFAAACRDAGLTFIGPSPEAIALMGSKTAARQVGHRAGVPVVPGTEEPLGDDVPDAEVPPIAERHRLSADAQGRGRRRRQGHAHGGERRRSSRAPSAPRDPRRGSAFGDSAVYLERRILTPRHIEVQLLGDQHGTVLPFVERECSIQRRHQKVVEESPSLAVSPDLRRRLTDGRRRPWRAPVGYTNAGTIEFLLDERRRVLLPRDEHAAAGRAPDHRDGDGRRSRASGRSASRAASGSTLDPAALLTPRGHAIECRIYAEDPDAGFMPSPGRIAGPARAARARASATTAARTRAARCRSSTTR